MTSLLQIPEIQPEGIEPAEIAFGEWLPDMPPLNNPGAVEALNVIPSDGCYIPFCQHVPGGFNETLLDPCRGAIAVTLPDDTVQIFAGTVNGLFTKIGGGAWSGLITGAYNGDYAWQFIRVNEQMVTLHQDYVPQRTEVGTLGPSALVGGTPPRAACGGQVRDFLVLGNLLSDPDDGGDPFPARIRWSGFNNIDAPWISDPATQADFQDMPAEGGPVMAIAGREVGTVFQTRMISRMTYRGLPEVFDITHVENKRGAISRDCVVDIGGFLFFIAEDGFFAWNGTNSSPIGINKVNRYFFNRLQWSMRSRIVGAHDPVNGCVMWAFPTDSSGKLNEIIIYSYRENKFSHSIQVVEYLFTSAASNVTIDELTDPLESYVYSFDDPSLRQGARGRLAAFNQAHTYGLFNGVNMAATMDTGEYSAPNHHRVFTNGVRPIVDLAVPAATVQTAMRDQMIGGPITFEANVAQELDGVCPILADARYMRFRVNLPEAAVWQQAVGVEVARKGGGRF